MPLFAQLNEEEAEIFVHLIRNRQRHLNAKDQLTEDLVDSACSNVKKAELAKISEEANLLAKNRYLLDNHVINYADKKRMPID